MSFSLKIPSMPHWGPIARPTYPQRAAQHVDTGSHHEAYQGVAAILPKARALVPLLGYLLVLLVIDAAVYTVPYGISDDYPSLAASMSDHFGIYTHLFLLGGRPVAALLEWLAFRWLNGVGDLRYLRFISILEVSALAWLIYRALIAAGLERRRALLVPLLICTMPFVQIYIAWAVLADAVLGAIMAGWAVLLMERARHAERLRRRILLWLASLLVLCGALALYQPSAMVFWLFVAIMLFVADRSILELARNLGIYLCIMGAGIAVEFAVVRVLPRLIYGHVDYPRAEMTHDLMGKVNWFVHEPLVSVLSLAVIPSSHAAALVVSAFATVGLLLYFRGAIAARLVKLLVAACLIPLSYVPSLVVAGNYGNYRTLVGPGSLVALYVALAIFGFTNDWPVGRRQIPTMVLAIAATFSAIGAFSTVTRVIALPQFEEYQVFATLLQSAQLTNATSIYVIPADASVSIAPFVLYDEFGFPSTAEPWGPPAMAYLVLHRADPAKELIPVVLGPPYGAAQPPSGSVVIDMHRLRVIGTGLP